MSILTDTFLAKVKEIHQSLNIPESFAEQRKLPLHREATELVEVLGEGSEKIHKLTRLTANAWEKMRKAAADEGVSLIIVSGYRGLEYQRTLIEKKLMKGHNILDILKILAPPGYSEHHTGTAIDMTTENCPPCVERFENTDAFLWLSHNADSYGFSLSYPRNNSYGFIYEPWHWAHRET